MFYNLSCSGPGPRNTNAICVYTCEYDMNAIGFKFVEVVKQDIKYKTDAATEEYRYAMQDLGNVPSRQPIIAMESHPSTWNVINVSL